MFINFIRPSDTPKYPLPKEIKTLIYQEFAKTFVAKAVRMYRSKNLTREDIRDIEQEAILLFTECIESFDLSRASKNPQSLISDIAAINATVLYIKSVLINRLQLARAEFFSNRHNKLIRELENEESSIALTVKDNFHTSEETEDPVEEREQLSAHYQTLSHKLQKKFKELFPNVPLALDNFLKKQKYYHECFKEDYFKFNTSVEVMSFLDAKHSLKPKMKKILEHEIFYKGHIEKFRSLDFILKLKISYDAQIKLLEEMNFNFTKQIKLIPVLNLFSEPRILSLLTQDTSEGAQGIVTNYESLNRMLGRNIIPGVKCFEDYLAIFPETLISKPKTLLEIHDWISVLHNNIAVIAKENTLLPYFNEFVDYSFDKYTVFLPRTELDLINIGNSLNICVGSYTAPILRFNSSIIALKENNKFTVCIDLDPEELSKGNIYIQEIKHAHNQGVSGGTQTLIKTYLQARLVESRMETGPMTGFAIGEAKVVAE